MRLCVKSCTNQGSVPFHEVDADDQMSDRELIQSCIGRDPKAWDRLVSLYAGLVFNVARKTLRTYGHRAADHDAEEISEDLLLSLVAENCKLLRTIGEPWDLPAWLAVTVRRRAIDFLRKRRLPTVSLDDPLRIGDGGAERSRVIADARPEAPTADEAAETRREADRRREALEEALAGLAPRERMMATLFYLKGKKYREIADALGVPINSVGPTLVRTLAKLQDKLKQKGIAL